MSNAYDNPQPPDVNAPTPPPPLPNQQRDPGVPGPMNDLNLPPPPQQQQAPQQQTNLPPGWGADFFGNFGPRPRPESSPATQQGKPPPTWPPTFRENRRQLYVPSMANRPPRELGKPPTFPHKPERWQVPNIYEGVGKQISRWGGSRQTRFLAGNLATFTNAYMRAMQGGQRDYAAQQHSRMTQTADALLSELGNELMGYGDAYASYDSDPDQLHGRLMDVASRLNDTEMQAALNTSPVMAERLQQWRQAKYDDLHRSNSVRREHDEELRASNPFMIKPIGPDGMPAERLPKPFETKPERMVKDRVQLASMMPAPQTKDRTENNPQGMQGGNVEQPAWRPPEHVYPGASPDMETPEDAESEGTTDLLPQGPDTPKLLPPDRTQEREPYTDEDYEKRDEERRRATEKSASRDGRVRLAQADTGTMSDAPPPGAQTVGDQDGGRTVWDDVRFRSERRAREAERQGNQSGGPGGQPAGQAGAGGQAAAGQAGQAQPGAQPGGTGQGGQPAAGGPQTNAQTVPPAGGPQGAQQTPPAAGGQQPLSPALQKAQQAGQDPADINGMAMRHLFGHMSATQYKGLSKPVQAAVNARETEVQNQLTGIIQSGKKGDEVLAEVEKINPVLAADMRAFKGGGPPPKTDPSGLFRPLMFAYDPTLNEATYRTRSKTMDNFASGPASGNLKSAGTFIRHADRLLKNLEHAPPAVMEAIYKHVPLAVLSRIPGAGETVRIMQEMEADRDAMGAEFATALAQGGSGSRGATGTERAEQAKHIDLYAPGAAIDRVREMKRLVEERVKQLQQQYETGTGMSFDAIKKQFDIPGMSEGGQPGGQQGGGRGLPPGVTIEEVK